MTRELVIRVAAVLIGVFAIGIGGCGKEPPASEAESDGRLSVYVSIPPQKYFVERVGGRHVRVGVLLKPGQSMHTYEPTPRQMVDLSSAKVYFSIGAPFERQVADKIRQALRDLKLVDTNEGIALLTTTQPCEYESHAPGREGEHEHEHEHAHSELDMHTWMSPRLVKTQALNICRALVQADPLHQADYEANLAAFHADLDAVDAEIAAALKPLKGRSFFVLHPAFGYFAEAYGLRQVAVESAGKQPSAKQIEELIEEARRSGVKLIFVQPQFSRRGAETVAQAIGGAVVPLDHLVEDYLGNLRHVAETIRAALTPQAEPGTAN
ncbi:MAG TPA: zinc ABC transporter substrate-binding protein [Phycisphaerae bacterium]|nr:zinc ABC transporter substrate-binding protein [Phycisphaerae bacterium]